MRQGCGKKQANTMNTVLVFNGAAVLALLESSRKAAKHSKAYKPDIDPGPGLELVKDSGIYLMSNDVTDLPTGVKRPVVYAEGYTPDADYDKVRDAVGGDDFVEALSDRELKRFFPCEEFHVVVTKRRFMLRAKFAKPATAKSTKTKPAKAK
jgi:hypothetical protein